MQLLKRESIGGRLSKTGCELFKKGSIGESKAKKGKIVESVLKTGVNVDKHPRHQFLVSPRFNFQRCGNFLRPMRRTS